MRQAGVVIDHENLALLADAMFHALTPAALVSWYTGKFTMAVVPWRGTLSKRTEPLCAWRILHAIASPRPVPTPSALVVKNGSKMWGRTSGSIPQPLSATRTSTESCADCAQVIRILP